MTLEELSARTEIHDVLLRYCRGLDRIDMALVAGAFHKDANIKFPDSLHKQWDGRPHPKRHRDVPKWSCVTTT